MGESGRPGNGTGSAQAPVVLFAARRVLRQPPAPSCAAAAIDPTRRGDIAESVSIVINYVLFLSSRAKADAAALLRWLPRIVAAVNRLLFGRVDTPWRVQRST